MLRSSLVRADEGDESIGLGGGGGGGNYFYNLKGHGRGFI